MNRGDSGSKCLDTTGFFAAEACERVKQRRMLIYLLRAYV